jgi:ATP-dependent Lhr-like helicase
MALAIQEGGISRHRLLPWIDAAYPFSSVRPERLQELIDTMLEREILHESDGLLSLGKRGEKLYGRKNFFELYAVFTAPPMMRVQHGKEDVGHVQALFVSMHDQSRGALCFRLSGRAWEVGQIEWSKGILHVRPAERGRVPSWIGLPGTLSTRLAQAMRGVLAREGNESAWLTRGATLELQGLRESYASLLGDDTAPLEDLPDGVTWHTFAGGAVNRLLSAGLEETSGKRWIAGNLSLRSKDLPVTEARDAVAALAALDWERVAASAARNMARGMVSKFQPCLPEAAEDRLLAEKLLDLPSTLRFLGGAKVPGTHVTLRPAGARLLDGETRGSLTIELRLQTPVGEASAPRNPIEWVDAPAALRALAAQLTAMDIVGLDVETTLDFRTLCLVQIATRSRNYLIDPFAVGDLTPLECVMNAPRPQKVIHNARFERRMLASAGIGLLGVIDTLEVSRRVRGADALGGHSLGMVCERELGVTVDKSQQTSNWSRRPLDAAQLRYAALDAEILLQLHDRFSREVRNARNSVT